MERLEPIPRPVAARLAWVFRAQLPVISFCITATLTAILWHYHTGRITLTGEVEVSAGSVVTYIGRQHRLRPVVGMPVVVRTMTGSPGSFESRIVDVGRTSERVPDHMLANPNVAEFGIPVHIAIPAGVELISGEPVSITVSTSAARAASRGSSARGSPSATPPP